MQPLRPKLYSAFVALWLSLSIASAVIAALTWSDVARDVERAVRTAGFNDTLNRIYAAVVDAETGQRGFIITGNDSYLDPYRAATNTLNARFAELSRFAFENPQLQADVVNFRVTCELALTEIRKLIELRRQLGFTAAADETATGRAKEAIDRLRQQVTQLRRQRPNLFTHDGEGRRRQVNRAYVTSLVAGFIGVGAGIFALVLSQVSLRQSQREQRLLEEKLNAERRSAEKTLYLANVSHEIRTPMNAIIGFSELLAGEVREPRHQKFLQAIRANSDSLLQLINDILDMSRVEAGQFELHLEPTDAREICEFVRVMFHEQATRKGIRLICEIAVDFPSALLLDRLRLRQVLVNLVGNAIKFTDAGFIRIAVGWERQPATSRVALMVEIEDTGVGIPQEKLEAVFKPFVRLERNHERERQGTGLGLAIVKRLVEAMGGVIAVTSTVGQGTTFHLRLPDVGISARLPVSTEAAEPGPVDFNELEPARILAVDDNASNRELMAGIFEGTHHQLLLATNGREAVDAVREHRPHLVLLDIRMPEMDGRTALGEIRRLPGCDLLPVIAVTASSQAGEENEYRRAFSGFVRKPFSRSDLFLELAHFLHRVPKPILSETSPLTRPPEELTPRRQTLLTALRRLEVDPWPTLRESLAVNEVRAFAAELRQLATAAECPSVLAYAENLHQLAETYAVGELEQRLGEFPKIVESVAESLA